ncbi:MAG: hypothetical protein K2K01_06590 [Eubacterium sp.]|nr:hypothetical protein [Eubacterium sp.]
MSVYENDNYVEVKNVEKQDEKKKKFYEPGGWLFISYPVIMLFVYAALGVCFGGKGWMIGWIVFLTIPLFYTGVIAAKKQKPIIFCYPVLATIVFLLFGFFANLWHPMWLVFLTIPIYYCVCAGLMQGKSK